METTTIIIHGKEYTIPTSLLPKALSVGAVEKK
jgi:hypothetical protein